MHNLWKQNELKSDHIKTVGKNGININFHVIGVEDEISVIKDRRRQRNCNYCKSIRIKYERCRS